MKLDDQQVPINKFRHPFKKYFKIIKKRYYKCYERRFTTLYNESTGSTSLQTT